jgi:hypothetical protein
MRWIAILSGILGCYELPGTPDSRSGLDSASWSQDTAQDSSDEPCPEGVVCIESFPATHSSTTTGASSELDSYSCAPSTDESGPELLYRLELKEAGYLALELSEDMATGVDLDVHLLSSPDADSCIDRGHWRAGSLLEAGTWWVSVDTWVTGSGEEQDGAYTLNMGLTSAAALVEEGMDSQVASDALHAFDQAWQNEDAEHFSYGITDFSLHSSEPRLWVLDLSTGEVLYNILVAHGVASSSSSDSGLSMSFSNIEDSHQSSLGMMQAAETYTGDFGYSMRLDGLEAGYNDAVRARYIVMHPWSGSREGYAEYYGAAAETWGCPAIDDRLSEEVIDFLANGGVLLFHYPDGDWSESSGYLP